MSTGCDCYAMLAAYLLRFVMGQMAKYTLQRTNNALPCFELKPDAKLGRLPLHIIAPLSISSHVPYKILLKLNQKQYRGRDEQNAQPYTDIDCRGAK